jgi:hypothetical protein
MVIGAECRAALLAAAPFFTPCQIEQLGQQIPI